MALSGRCLSFDTVSLADSARNEVPGQPSPDRLHAGSGSFNQCLRARDIKKITNQFPKLRAQHVLRPLRAGQEGALGPDLAGRSLGQEADEGSRLRDQHREVC